VKDVTRAIKGMSDRAPGPDGRTLNDLKALRREEIAAHSNVWLYAGYPPTPLCSGETVLIARGECNCPRKAPPHYHLGHNS